MLLEGEIPSPIRAVGDEPTVLPMIEVGPGHFVAALYEKVSGQRFIGRFQCETY